MNVLILSAGRGSRLHPLTENLPKCLLPIGDKTVLGHQLAALRKNGIEDAFVVTGFRSDLVEAEIAKQPKDMNITTIFNPFFEVSDNLASCWIARDMMDDNFLLINGDTLFESDLLAQVLASETNDIQITIDRKDAYDWDDMKVTLDGDELLAIGKDLTADRTNGESIGMLRFIGEGVFEFRAMLERIMHSPAGTKSWFLSAIDAIAKSDFLVSTFSIEGAKWAELDTPADYTTCCALFGGEERDQQPIHLVVV